MKSKFLGIVISMLCATSFLAANGTVDAKTDKSILATNKATEIVKPETTTEAAKKEVAVADEVAKAEEAAVKAKKAEETKCSQDKKSCTSCK